MGTIKKLEKQLSIFLTQLAGKIADGKLMSDEPIIDLSAYASFKVELAQAWLNQVATEANETRLRHITTAADQLDRALTVAETIRYRANYC